MKKALKVTAIILLIVFIAAQLYRPDFTNPPIILAETLESAMQVPEDVALDLKRSCHDCHSNETVYPWYSKISPFSWLLADHIEEGRSELNFSVWNTYTAKKKRRKLDEICEQVTNGEMPHNQYLWIHTEARLSEDDKKTLCEWTATEKAKLPAE